MDIKHKIAAAKNLTPTEVALGQRVLELGDSIQALGIKELASMTNASIASVHRFCKKLGLEGFKELKVELARSSTEDMSDVDINFPFSSGEYATQIMARMEKLYRRTLKDTHEMLDANQMNHAAEYLVRAEVIDIYTGSHNLYPARMFRDRILSTGKIATCHTDIEQLIRTAAASNPKHVAIAISYSGLSPNFKPLLPILTSTKTPVIVIGSPNCARLHPGFAAYLLVSDLESYTDRITQFASHMAVQYVLDTLFSCYVARDYDRALGVLESTSQYTRLPGLS